MLAKKAATLDEISGGRLILGLGAGWNETEYSAFGFPYDHRVSRFEEAFTIIRTLLREGRCDFDGTYYQVRDCELLPRGPRPEGPPLMVGSDGERMLGITLPHVQAWNAWFAWFDNGAERYRALRERIDAACRTAGRDPAEVERTAALFVAFPDAVGRSMGDRTAPENESLPSEPMKTCGLPAPITSAVMKSPTAGMKVSSDPATTPGSERTKVTRQKAWARLAYRSVAASISRRSIFSIATYSGRIMKGRKL